MQLVPGCIGVSASPIESRAVRDPPRGASNRKTPYPATNINAAETRWKSLVAILELMKLLHSDDTADASANLPIPSVLAPFDIEAIIDAAVERGLDRDHVAELVRDAPPMWAGWGTVESRADDLALVVRPLGINDLRVRVNAPTDASREWEVTVVALDRSGLLSITATVLAQNHVSVASARIASWPTGQAIQTLRVRPDETSSVEPPWPFIGQDLRHALLHGAPRVGALAGVEPNCKG